MNYMKIDYSNKTESLDIYLCGCKKEEHCKGCHNKKLQDFSVGERVDENFKAIFTDYIKLFPSMIKKVLIMGGDPLDQSMIELEQLLKFINGVILPPTKTTKLRSKQIKVFLFTGHELKTATSICNENPFISDWVDYLKVGPYDPVLKVCEGDNTHYGIDLMSSNQFILELS